MAAAMDTRECVLLIKHFPCELTVEDASELLSNFGSIGTVKHSRKALSRLHQLKVLNRRLVVEFVNQSYNDHLGGTTSWSIDSTKAVDVEEGGSKGKKSDLQEKLQEFSRNLNAVGKAFGLDYPMSAKLFYSYPRPSTSTLHNINNALVTVPKFYFQVLHLMNKMNLPAPFGPALHFPELPLAAGDGSEMTRYLEDEESELESETDEHTRGMNEAFVVGKRRRLSKGLTTKRPRLQQTVQRDSVESHPSKDGIRPAEVFELPTSQLAKKIEFKLDVTLPTNSSVPIDDGFGTFGTNLESNSQVVIESVSDAPSIEKTFVSDEELAKNRISREDLELLPVFKNYDSGIPTRRLYLKNLAKQVVEADLTFIYRRYSNENDEETMFDIRLMKEGRMKGQAFVTFRDENCALKALQQTNGYVLHGKPIVVQFARCDKGN